jgi:hypothetical protein
LLRGQAASGEPRLRDAIIALLLLHPELAGAVAAEGLGCMDPQVFAAHYQALRDQIGA